MKIQILITIIVLVVLGLGIGIFVYQSFTEPETEKIEEEKTEEPEIQKQEEKEAAESVKETTLVKDDFTIMLPPYWEESTAVPELLAMGVDTKEEIIDERVKDIGFRTNFSMKKDNLEKYEQINNVREYAQSLKTPLIQAFPGIEFTHEEATTISGNDVFFIECETIRQEISFKTLLTFIGEDNGTVWVISFNTLKDSWSVYRDTFYQIAESFKPKQAD